MMSLKFSGTNRHDLIETLIKAVEITNETGKHPSIEVDGTVYADFDLVKVARLLPGGDEPLEPRHQAMVDPLFQRRQHGYLRTGWNLAHKANSIASARAAYERRVARDTRSQV